MNKEVIMLLDNSYDPDPRVEKSINALIEHGFIVTLLAKKNSNKKEFEGWNNFSIQRIFDDSIEKYYKLNPETTLNKIINIIQEKNTKIIFANDFICLHFACLLKKKIPDIKIFYDAHEYIQGWYFYQLEIELMKKIKGKIIHSIYSHNERKDLKQVNAISTVSQGIADLYKKIKGDIPIGVLRNVPNLKNIDSTAVSDYKKNLNLPEDKIIITHCGAWYYPKNHISWVLELILELSSKMNLHFLFILQDSDLRKLEQFEQFEKAKKHISIHGFVPYTNLINLLNTSDIGLILNYKPNWPSHWNSLPNRIFDYIHAGLAILSTPQPEFKSILEKNNNGQTFLILNKEDFKNKLTFVIDNLNELKSNSIKAKDKNCWAVEKHTLIELIDKMIDE